LESEDKEEFTIYLNPPEPKRTKLTKRSVTAAEVANSTIPFEYLGFPDTITHIIPLWI